MDNSEENNNNKGYINYAGYCFRLLRTPPTHPPTLLPQPHFLYWKTSYEINIDALVYNKRGSNTPHKVPEKGVFLIGPLHMLPGQVLSSVHMGNFSPVDWHKIRETKTNWCISVVSFVTVAALSTPVINFTNKDNLHTCEVDTCHLGRSFAKAKLFCQKSFVPVTGIVRTFLARFGRYLGISATKPAHLHIWTLRNVYKGLSGVPRSRKPG